MVKWLKHWTVGLKVPGSSAITEQDFPLKKQRLVTLALKALCLLHMKHSKQHVTSEPGQASIPKFDACPAWL